MEVWRYFNKKSMMLLYGEEKGEGNEGLSFGDGDGWGEREYYEKVGKWFYKWFKKD